MRISVIGSGYVGTTIAAAFADLGHTVTAIDIDAEIVQTINDGNAPIHEPGLAERIERTSGDQLTATTEYDAVLETDMTFLALPTPTTETGAIDTSIIEAAADTLGETLADAAEHTVIVKSTVVPGTTESVLAPLVRQHTSGEIAVGMNPEFLREGSALADFLAPDKIVFGTADEQALADLRTAFEPVRAQADPAIVETGLREAEMIKYANNAFLAAKVSLINDIGNICKQLDVDAYEVADAIGHDHRISDQFLRSGVGFGGSCFPKDVRAISNAAQDTGYEPPMLTAALEVNALQPERLLALLDEHVDVAGKRVAVLGLSFKPGTDDIRNSRAIPVIEGLLDRGANPVGYDPVAVPEMRNQFPEIDYTETARDALTDAVGALVVTGWDEFATLDTAFRTMARPVVIDGRHVIEPATIETPLTYEGLTW